MKSFDCLKELLILDFERGYNLSEGTQNKPYVLVASGVWRFFVWMMVI